MDLHPTNRGPSHRLGPIPWGSSRALLGFMAATLLFALPIPFFEGAPGGAAQGAGLEALDVDLGGEPIRMDLVPRHPVKPDGPSDVAVVVSLAQGKRLGLRRVRLTSKGAVLIGQWTAPPGTSYAEPVNAPGLDTVWLALGKEGWRLGWLEGADLVWQDLCRCATATLPNGPGAPDVRNFARDMDGLPGDEILLPFPDYLGVYRLHTKPIALIPHARASWNSERAALPFAGGTHQLPRFHLKAINAPGNTGLVRFKSDHILLARFVSRSEQKFRISAPVKAFLLDRAARKDWPVGPQNALAELPLGDYEDAEALLEVLAGKDDESTRQATNAWTPWFPEMLTVLAPLPAGAPARPVALSGLGVIDPEEDRVRLMALTDMDGDGLLDLLHAKMINHGSVFKQKNQLRWYRGASRGERFEFAPPVRLIESDAGSFADVVILRTDPTPPLALLLATAEVSFSSVMKALTSREVTLSLRILPWRHGGVQGAAVAEGSFTYRELGEGGRRAMFLPVDLDGDGLRDFAANFGAEALSIFLRTAAGGALTAPTFTQGGLPLPSHPSRVLIADLDGDGREELVLRFQQKHHETLGRKLRIVRYRP